MLPSTSGSSLNLQGDGTKGGLFLFLFFLFFVFCFLFFVFCFLNFIILLSC